MSKFVYKRTKLVRIDSRLHSILKVSAARKGISLKDLIQSFLIPSPDLKKSHQNNLNEDK